VTVPIRIAMWSGPRNISAAMTRAFVTGALCGFTPVREEDGHVMPAGTPGPVTQRLRKLYDALKDAQAR
jgi:branched-chain amino acid aminotransferase